MRIRMLSARTESLWDRPGHPTSGTLFRYAFARFSDPRTYAPSARLTPSNAIKKLVHTPMPALPHFFLPLPPPVHARLAGPIRKRSKRLSPTRWVKVGSPDVQVSCKLASRAGRAHNRRRRASRGAEGAAPPRLWQNANKCTRFPRILKPAICF